MNKSLALLSLAIRRSQRADAKTVWRRFACVLPVGVALLHCGSSLAQSDPAQGTADATLLEGFQNPPASALPRVWWHWMNGNITQEGIKLDLEWMRRSHLGGFQNFDAALFTPQYVDKRLVYMTPEWKQAFRYATDLANSFGMEEAIASSPGWSETGGPWVPAREAMKKYVWSETPITGGRRFSGKLKQPPTNTGAFQNLPVHDVLEGGGTMPQFYADSAVIAYRIPVRDEEEARLRPVVTSSDGAVDAGLLADGDLLHGVPLKKAAAAGGKAWIQFAYPQPQAIRAVTFCMHSEQTQMMDWMGVKMNGPRVLEASEDGIAFRRVLDIPIDGAAQHTVTFPPVAARFFRLSIETPEAPTLSREQLEAFGAQAPKADSAYDITELVLHPGARVHRFEEKAAFVPVPDLYRFATPAAGPGDAIEKNTVVNLTGQMRPDGSLDWTPPPGNWMVLRFGYSLLGITNHPATKEAAGLEVDKLNAGYVKNYMDGYLNSYQQTVGPENMGARGIRYVVTDSWEAGAQNWTDNMIGEFTKRRGYDPHPWMPVLAGHLVESSEASDQFLWDLRKTIADLTADEHYGQVQASLRERGMGHYGESHEDNRAFVADGMEVKKLDDIPMSAMWTQTPGVNKVQYNFNADDRESASVAHIYGQNLAAAESMTAAQAPWAWSPETLKPTADQELLNGINRFVIHESAHQPFANRAPGLTLGPFGQWFNRNETWADNANVWIDYLARSSYMLQQGRFVADVLYFYGEDSNLTAIFHTTAPNVPAGYNFDYVNADALVHQFVAADGRIMSKAGMGYRVLVLDPYAAHMSLPVLRAIHTLVEHGALVAGGKPVGTPSLADDAVEFNRLNRELFGDGSGLHSIGQGKVYAGAGAAEALHALGVAPDFDSDHHDPDSPVLFAHRNLPGADIYFVDNRSDQPVRLSASFRVSGREPRLWYAETGKTRAAAFTVANGRTEIPLALEPWGTVFVVFARATTQTTRTLPALTETAVATLSGSWSVAFQPGRGAPASAEFGSLQSWSESVDKGVKYFSGTGTYTKTVQASPEWFRKESTLWLDLGDVKNLAKISVNGRPAGVLWHSPFRADVSGLLHPGANEIAIEVTNLWVNRLIGDQQPDATTKYTFADVKPYKADSSLLPSGLLGPVRLIRSDDRGSD